MTLSSCCCIFICLYLIKLLKKGKRIYESTRCWKNSVAVNKIRKWLNRHLKNWNLPAGGSIITGTFARLKTTVPKETTWSWWCSDRKRKSQEHASTVSRATNVKNTSPTPKNLKTRGSGRTTKRSGFGRFSIQTGHIKTTYLKWNRVVIFIKIYYCTTRNVSVSFMT